MAIKADLDNAFLLYNAARLLAPGIDPEPVVQELRERMGDELDYRLEADNQEEFRLAYQGHPWIWVPRVHRRWSTGRVLVSDWVSGRSFYDVCAGSQAERDEAGEKIFRFFCGSIAKLQLFNADPHPGNYFFADPAEDGPAGIWFLDFGLAKRFGPGEVDSLRDRVAALRSRDDDAVLDAMRRHGWIRPGAQLDPARAVALARLTALPLVEHRPFTYTSEYISETIQAMFAIDGAYGDVIRQMTLPKDQVILTRIQIGLGGLFARLGATNNWARILDEYLFDAPPSTPLGEASAGWPIGT